MKGPDLEALRELLSDGKLWVGMGEITALELGDDRSVLRAKVSMWPERDRDIIARCTWTGSGHHAGFIQFPQVGNIVIVAYPDSEEDHAVILGRFTSRATHLPPQAVGGDTVMAALAGKKSHVLSDTEVLLGRGGADPSENLVLGLIYQAAYSTHLDADAKHRHIGNFGFLTPPPDNKATYEALKASPVDDDEMLSDLTKTEK